MLSSLADKQLMLSVKQYEAFYPHPSSFYIPREGNGASHEDRWCKEELVFYLQRPLLHDTILIFLQDDCKDGRRESSPRGLNLAPDLK